MFDDWLQAGEVSLGILNSDYLIPDFFPTKKPFDILGQGE